MTKLGRVAVVIVGIAALATICAYWWSNVPPKRPKNVSADAVFLWSGHLGLPAPKHGTWIKCWLDMDYGVNKCKLIEMDGKLEYEGVFLANEGNITVPQAELMIETEPTSDSTNWVRLEGMRGAPLVFLRNGTVLIPKDAYQEGMAKLEHLRQVQGR